MSQTFPIILNLVAAVFGALGQLLYKQGAMRLGTVPIYLNWQIFLGALSFVVVMLLFISAFKMGGLLSVTYPVYATTFIWGALISYYYLHETVSMGQLAGIFLIVLGVSCIGYFSSQS